MSALVVDGKVEVEPIHNLMRGWAKTANFTAFSRQQAVAQQNFSHVLEELRKVVGHEGER